MNQLKKETSIGLTLLPWLMLFPQNASAMHIMEGFLPPVWALTWWILFIPFLALGIRKLKQIVSHDSHQKVLLALCGAFIFVLSALKLPSVTGSCSHPTGVGLAIISGPTHDHSLHKLIKSRSVERLQVRF